MSAARASRSLIRRVIARPFRWWSVDPLVVAGIDDEIENHIQERADRLVEQGLSPRAARREAEERFGDVRRTRRDLERIDRAVGAARGPGEIFGSFFRDVKQGARSFAKAPGFAAAVVLTVGLGVGANAAVFSITDAVLLRALPYEAPEELIAIEAYYAEDDRTLDRMPVARALAWKEAAPDLEGFLVFARVDFVRTGVEDPVGVAGFAVGHDWLGVLGVEPPLGRSFSEADAVPGAPAVVILSHRLWRDTFGEDRNVVGRTLELDRRSHTVVGVMPPDFKFPVLGPVDAWVPMMTDGTVDGIRSTEFASLLGRMAPGQELASAQERLDAVSSGLTAADPQPDAWEVRVREFDYFRANTDVRRALWVLTGAVAVMLLIATTNAANLLLVRATARQGEIAVRRALGASRGRLVRQHLTENLILVAAGSVVAVLLARAVLDSIVGLLPSEVTFFLTTNIAVNRRVLVFALALTALTGLILSAVPALRSTRGATAAMGVHASAARSTSWLRSGLVVAEVAMTVTLLVAAGLLINSFVRLTSVDPGYNPATMVQVSLSLPAAEYPDSSSRRAFFDALKERISGLPGVTSVSLADGVPPGGSITFGVTPQAEGGDPKNLPGLYIPSASVDTDYFRVLGAPIVAGRGFGRTDSPESGHVIVDRDTAEFFWGTENPIGRRFRLDADDESPWLTVIGLIGDLKLLGQDDRHGTMDIFYPLPSGRARSFMSLVIGAGIDPTALLPSIRGAVRALNPDLPIYRLRTGSQALAEENDKARFFLVMMVIFASIALGLAIIGTYSVLTFAVRRRQRELGIRLALGAEAARVKLMVMKQGVVLAGAGVILGLVGAVLLGRLAQSLLFDLAPTDPLTYALVSGVMLASAALACWVPAQRATRVDPVEVLRTE